MMKKWCLAGLFFLSGCTVSTTFRCTETPCQPYYKASGQCLAEANSLHHIDYDRKDLFFRQCMAEKGYREYECHPHMIYENPCQSFYVY